MTPFEAYLHDLCEIRSTGAGVKETSYYPALSDLLKRRSTPCLTGLSIAVYNRKVSGRSAALNLAERLERAGLDRKELQVKG